MDLGAQYEPLQNSSLARKLGLESGSTFLVVNAPAGYLDGQTPRGEGADGAADLVLLFASNRAQLDDSAAAALNALKPRGSLWIAYPSEAVGRSDLNRNHGGGALGKSGVPSANKTEPGE